MNAPLSTDLLKAQAQNDDRVREIPYNYTSFSDKEILEILESVGVAYRRLDSLSEYTSKAIADGKVVGWFQGALEFGDRALGNRSILADPRDPKMKEKVNALIKYREDFRPFAPAILADCVEDYFVNASDTRFMEKISMIRQDKQHEIPSVTHADGTGRLQTVTAEQNPAFYELIKAFYELTGTPIIMNTSFNIKGEPIVCTPADAIRTFFSSGLDVLILGNFLVEK